MKMDLIYSVKLTDCFELNFIDLTEIDLDQVDPSSSL